MEGSQDSGMQQICTMESGIRNPDIWNPEYCLRNPESP